MKKCPICERRVMMDEALFCPYCGNAFPASDSFCVNCGSRLQADYDFCPLCGTRVNGEIAGSPFYEMENELHVHHWLDYGESNLYRDYNVKSRDAFSYCLRDSRPNDLRLIRKFKLEPDTVYYVTADIRTDGVVNHENSADPIGACISTSHFYCSRSLFGTCGWQTVGVLGRSDESGVLEVSFNLGYYFNTCSGTAWFENLRFISTERYFNGDNTWRFLAVILRDTGIDTLDPDTGERIRLSHKPSVAERDALKNSLRGFERDLTKDAEGLFRVKVDIVEPTAKCDSYTKNGFGYTLTAPSAREYLAENGIDISGYDHVIMIACLPELPANYFGLGGLCIDGKIGYSFVLHRDVQNCIEYLNGRRPGSRWPSALYVHEFFHSIEACSRALGLDIPEVDGAREGYSDREEYRDWYRDFIKKNIGKSGEKRGADPRLWRLRPSLFR